MVRWKNDKRAQLMKTCIAELRADPELPKDRHMDYLIGAHGHEMRKWKLKPEDVMARIAKQDALTARAQRFDSI